MATLQEIWNLHQQATVLKSRTAAACATAALAVFAEDVGTTNHAARLVWANSALRDADAMAAQMFWGVLGNPTVQAAGDATTDGDLQWVVSNLVNTFATGT